MNTEQKAPLQPTEQDKVEDREAEARKAADARRAEILAAMPRLPQSVTHVKTSYGTFSID